MFSQRKRPLLLVADRMLSLRLSLNTPVVSTPELPAGPARAAIAVHSEAGRPCFTVAVRSLRNGDSVLYELEGEDLDDASGMAVALDAALSFGESMGFLFDDELIVSREEAALRAAVKQLREIVAPPAPDVGETAPSLDLEPPAEEILLEEELEAASAPSAEVEDSLPPTADPDASDDRLRELVDVRSAPAEAAAPAPTPQRAPAKTAARSAAKPAPAAAKKPPAPAKPTLTKFRATPPLAPTAAAAPTKAEAAGTTGGAPAGPAATGGGALLGRVKPVRRRPPDAPPPVHPLLRLLAWF